MKLLDLTLDSPADNLALDEALLEEAEAGRLTDDVLRLWESPCPAVIIGRSSRYQDEVDVAYCHEQSISILRRCSGGASVVIGPGCLMYSVVLAYARYPQLRMLDVAHRFVLERVAAAVRGLVPETRLQGTSDLTIDGRKFSGNSLRCKRDHLLYHGTLLCDFDLSLISKTLRTPPRQPEYRAGRSHEAFVANLHVLTGRLRESIVRTWRVEEQLQKYPADLTQELAAQRYSQASWNERL